MNGYFRRCIKSLSQKCYPYFAKIVIPFSSKSLLIVRLDAIGDYVLFRNGLEHLKNSEKYKHYDFYLLGNIRFEGIATFLDTTIFKKNIFIDPEILRYPINKKRLSLLVKLKLNAFDVIINPVHSRVFFIDEFINDIGGKVKIGSKGDITNWPSPDFEEYSNKFYNKLVDVPALDCFEFFRNKRFVENLLEERIASFDLQIPVETVFFKNDNKKPEKRIVIVPGASTPLRRWDVKNFVRLVEKLSTHLKNDVEFIIVGSAIEKPLGDAIINGVSQNIAIKNNVGNSELNDLVKLINSADLVISNETSAVHIAAAVSKPVICISGPNYYGRFHPYPKEMGKPVSTIYPEGFKAINKDTTMDEVNDEIKINSITVESVFGLAKSILSNLANNSD